MMSDWIKWVRPGYFGRRRDEKIADLNRQHGEGNWKLAWVVDWPGYVHPADGRGWDAKTEFYDFDHACQSFYTESYIRHFHDRAEDLDFLCSFGECYDNALTNVESGLDYSKQEAYSTHIQDIAVRNMLKQLGRKFEGPKDRLLEIRSKNEGLRFSPGAVPFFNEKLITQPSLSPKWAEPGSVEDFWQSNKWVLVKEVPDGRRD